MGKVEEAREFLETRRPGEFAAIVRLCLESGGVVHCAPDCFLAGLPCGDAPETLYIAFQCSHLPALRRVLASLPFARVRWQRAWGHGDAYGVRERSIADFFRHEDFGTGLARKVNKKVK